MNLKKIEVENYRLLKDFDLYLKDELSLLIGKNNCGKTSAILILDKMLNQSRLTWDDINLEHQKDLYDAIMNFDDNDSKPFEAVTLRIFIEYDEKDSYRNIQMFMMDLNPDNNFIVLEFVLLLSTINMKQLYEQTKERDISDFVSFSKFISKNFSNYFEIRKHSRGFDPESNAITDYVSEEVDTKDIQKVIKLVGIRADRQVSNDDRNHVLSSLTSKYFTSYKNSNNERDTILSELENELIEADKRLYKIYNGDASDVSEEKKGIFTNIINVIRRYGGTDSGIDISIDSSISEKNLLENNTSLSYRQNEECYLPETYNGLGYLNLIGILFEIETRLQEIYEQPADINILYIEEPEAHTHPQLQYVFIRNIKDHIRSHRLALNNEKGKQLQLLMTSHSSHIVSECDFDDIIYLKKHDNTVTAKSFDSLKEQYEGDDQQAFKFVKQYLTLNRSELFFADKAICIEGDTERMLMTSMMQKVDADNNGNNGHIPLISQNISIIEVGAHSHTFMPLFSFLGTKVLIITDVDSVKKEKREPIEVLVSCPPQEGTHTSNESIKNFFKDDNLDQADNQFKALINMKAADKVKGKIRIAYQIPEVNGGYQARSFEDAFIALNKEFILKNDGGFYKYGALKRFKAQDIEDYYKFAKNKIEKKSAFASCLLYFDGKNNLEWKVPRYIEEGLIWIMKQ